jgi:hydrogenase maturation protease
VIVVAGIGNELLGDDGFGPVVARALAGVDLGPGVTVRDVGLRGVHLAYDIADGVDTLVAVDLVDVDEPPGTVVVLDADVDDVARRGLNGHGTDLIGLVELARRVGRGPLEVLVVGCPPRDCRPGTELSAPVAGAVGPTVTLVGRLVDRLRKGNRCSDG